MMSRRELTEHPLRKYHAAVWLLLALVTPLFVNLWVEQLFEASKIWLLRTLIWLLAVLWLAGRLAGLRAKPLPPIIRNLLVALVLVLLLSTLFSTNHYLAIFGTLDRANGLITQLSYLILFGCVAGQIDARGSRLLLQVIMLTAIPICLLGLAQAVGWQPLPVFSDARSPITTTLGRANFSGAYLALLVPLTLAATQQATHQWQRGGYAVLVILEVAVIALTQARAAWIATLAGIGLLFWLQTAPGWSARMRQLSVFGGAIVLAGGLMLILQWGIAAGGSIAARWTIWQASLRLLWPRLWLGYGADTLELHFPSVYPPQLVYYQGRGVVVDRAHNWVLDWSLDYGIVATAIFAGLISLILWRGWQQLQRNDGADSAKTNRWLVACIAAICAHLVGNLFLFDVAATALLFWLLLAVVTAATLNCARPSDVLPPPDWRRYGLVGASIVILIWVVWHSNIRPMLADVHSWRGTWAVNQGEPWVALLEYMAAVEAQPRRAEYQVALALIAAQVSDFDLAKEAIGEAIGLRPTDPVLYTQLAAIYGREAIETASSAKIPLAYEAYEQAIALAPTLGLTHRHYADFAFRSGNRPLALRQAQRAVDLDATDGLAFGIMGWTQLWFGNLDAAEQAFDQAVKWQPNSADFHLGLATAYFQQGNMTAARRAVQQSLRLDPNYGPALQLQLRITSDE